LRVGGRGHVTGFDHHRPERQAAEYAAARIGHFWRVEQDPAKNTLSVFCYRLDPTTGTYASAGIHSGKMTVTEPVAIELDLAILL
jgi:hypothetical protein